jgi:hypothetical protein
MKTVLSTIIILAIALTSCNKEKTILNNQLPSDIKSYVSTHFPNNAIIQSVVDKDGFTKTYDVFLEGNFQLEFNRKYKITDIDGISKLPNSVVPEKIRTYVNINYPNNIIIGWELDEKNQQIKLNNGLDLEFNMQGNFLRIDN